MKSALFYGPRDIRIQDGADAEPGPGQVLLDVTAVGVCGSDLHSYVYGDVGGVRAESAVVLGHEAAGIVVAPGPGVDKARFAVGQRVAIDPATPCGKCERCMVGDPHLCLNLVFIGLWPHHGALCERMLHPVASCFPVPENVSDEAAALLEPLGVALHAIRLARVQVGEDVLVIGCGGIGLLLIQLARLAGARRIFASDKNGWRLDLAANSGADVVFNADQVDAVAEVMRATNRRGVDVALEAAWVKDTAAQCVEAARYGGRVVIVGIPVEDVLTVRASAARRKELSIINTRRMKHVYPATISLAATGKVRLDALASHRFPLAKTRDAFETAATYADSVVRAMVLPNAKG